MEDRELARQLRLLAASNYLECGVLTEWGQKLHASAERLEVLATLEERVPSGHVDDPPPRPVVEESPELDPARKKLRPRKRGAGGKP